MSGKLLLAGKRLEDLTLRERLDVAEALLVEGLGPDERREVMQKLPGLWQRFAIAAGREEDVREAWGTSPEAVAGQQQLIDLLGQGA